MRLCRFGDGRLGLVEGSNVRDVTEALDVLPAYRYPLPRHDVLMANLDKVTARIRTIAANAPTLPLATLKLLSPVANPGKIIGAPVNYAKHLAEAAADKGIHHGQSGHLAPIENAGVFLKATSSVVGPGEGIAVRKLDRRTDHEVELAFVIGKEVSHVSKEDAMQYVAGYCIGLDITIRGPEERSLRKSVDTHTVLGPWLVTADEIPDPGQLDLRITVNGQIRQDSNTSFLIWNVAKLIEYATTFYTLYPGDVITTGTPEGVGPIQPNDELEATVDKIGSMKVAVRAWEPSASAARVGG